MRRIMQQRGGGAEPGVERQKAGERKPWEALGPKHRGDTGGGASAQAAPAADLKALEERVSKLEEEVKRLREASGSAEAKPKA